ncbi:MAG: LruC domain-containing protein [Spirochaetia bacterium]|nr:LruC domain-containing protein [Spirochaetia bacterium]
MRLLTSGAMILCFILITAGCPQGTVLPVEFSELKTDKTFNYETTRTVAIDLSFTGYPFILVDLYAAIEITDTSYAHDDPFEEFTPLGTILLSGDGFYSAGLSVPSAATILVISPRYIGLPGTLEAPIVSDTIDFTYSESDERTLSTARAAFRAEGSYEENGFLYVSPFDTNGKPDAITSAPLQANEINAMLKRIQASLPEYGNVPETNPGFLNDAQIALNDDARIQVTFLHEGAGFLNTLGYYAFATDAIPDASPGIMAENGMSIIFPNASINYGGGSIKKGDTLDLGTIAGGNTLIWSLITSAWSARTAQNTAGTNSFYSYTAWNPEESDNDKHHTVLFYDQTTDSEGTESAHFIIGFEDLKRDYALDQDFNDLLFMVTVTPASSVIGLGEETESGIFTPPKQTDPDTDEDGIFDTNDLFPDHKGLSGRQVYSGTVAFEDQWPDMGDYDFNDLVLDYTYTIHTGADNTIRSLTYSYTITALGATRKNGVSVKFPISEDDLFSPTDNDQIITDADAEDILSQESSLIVEVTEGVHGSTSDGIVIRLSDSIREELFNDMYPAAQMVNTVVSEEHYEPATITGTLYITDGADLTVEDLGAMPGDVFMIKGEYPPQGGAAVNKEQYEIHLPGRAPSGLIEQVKLNVGDDASAINGWYKTRTNLPWAIHVPEFDHPLEQADILDAYPDFARWAMNSGSVNADWYREEHRIRSYIYRYQVE